MSAQLSGHPRVRLVVLNWNGGELVRRALRSLEALRWPGDRLDLVVVDNASTDGSDRAIEAEHPRVRLIRSTTNVGFPANNLALRDLGGVDLVGLVNPDATVMPDYLEKLVPAFADTRVAAAAPKILFASQARAVTVRSNDRVRLVSVRVDGVETSPKVLAPRGHAIVDGAPPQASRQLASTADLAIPVASADARVELCVVAEREITVELATEDATAEAVVGTEPVWVTTPPGGVVDVVNNAGGELYEHGYAGDRGLGEPDRGQYDAPVEVFAWTGGAVVMRPDYLRDVGLFDERFFLYYEDTQLSWRGRLRGWRYRYVPDAVVRHVHAASTVEGSSTFVRYGERNRLAMITTCAPASFVWRALVRYIVATVSYAANDLVRPVLRGRAPRPRMAWLRVRALAGFLAVLPHVLRERARIRRNRSVPDGEVLAWLRPAVRAD